MTTLNTIIEEEKHKLFDHIEKLEHGIQQWNGLNVWEAEEMDDHADLIEFAMQRAYEAGRVSMGLEILNSTEFKTLENSLNATSA